MFEKLELTRMAQGLAAHAGARMAVIARNIAHADTPGYRAADLPAFAQVYRGGPNGATGDGAASARPAILKLAADPNGNTVALEDQMRRMAETRQGHEMALSIYRSTSAVVRVALGRGGQ
ncbi:flagellar basal body rod protein FlgB [Paragemmobacter ruber]|uniref:Flagellar basal body rod protein FlgB n=1 Tax=Paragemmobacter ruber TaxID=1985673 RepID=A0ABW9Y671_9RHOB|nr:flagellar basal body rod protein FlgB [Rhodobacter ruber]NBE07387.1 flagellar basal body rod protein FlgB [Rhodobacter ruber]